MKSKPFPMACVCLLTACHAMHASADEARDDIETVQASRAADAEVVGTPPASHAHSGMHSEEEALKEAVWYAAAEGNMGLLRRLLRDEDVDVDATTVGQVTTALWIASQQGHTDVVRLLLARGAAIDATDGFDGRTPLFQASQDGHSDVVRLLLERGAQVEVRSARTGATPLFVAAARGHTEIVQLLLAANADLSVTATAHRSEDTPLSIAKERGHAGVVKLLEEAAADTAVP